MNTVKLHRAEFENRLIAEMTLRQMKRRRAVFCMSCGANRDERQFIVNGLCHICMEVQNERG